MKITEPVTMLTDYLLCAVSLFFALRLLQQSRKQRSVSILLWGIGFACVAAAAALGGSYHGFSLYWNPITEQILWNSTVFFIGAGSAFMISGTLASSIKRDDVSTRWLISGLSLSVAGLAVQQSGIELHEHFNHNDLYHCIQLIALYLFYRGAYLLAGP